MGVSKRKDTAATVDGVVSTRAGVSRREFMAVAGLAAAGGAAMVLTGCDIGSPVEATPAAPFQTYRSRKDLQPPAVIVNTADPRTAPGLIFLAAQGPLILDEAGAPVWYLPYTGSVAATNVAMQQLHGHPVLTWWQGTIIPMGYGQGEYLIYDSSYRHLRTVRAAGGLQGDLHEFLLTPSGTALFTAYTPKPWDLREWGGPKHGHILDSVVQEVDVSTGRLLFEWRASEHVAPFESYAAAPTGASNPVPYDYFHVNAIDVDDDGNLLVSARNTWTVYKIARPSGTVLWRLGGKLTSFTMGPGTQFSWQHDARRQPDGTITLFDDGAAPQVEQASRGLILAVDETDMTANVLQAFVHPQNLLSTSQGSVQEMPNENVFIGYGSLPNFSEYDPEGNLLFDATFVGQIQSYRARRAPWVGSPRTAPDIAVEPNALGGTTVYASWNGSTRASHWRVVGGPAPEQLQPLTTVARSGFETAIAVRAGVSHIAVEALDKSGTRLGRSAVLATGG